MEDKNILIWLPSPMGDAVLCTPALRAIRQHFKSSRISFLANDVVRQVLSPSDFNDTWLKQEDNCPFAIARMLKPYKFTHAILFKNSFGSGLATFLAAIPVRVGYARQGRHFLLTDRLYPRKLAFNKYEPTSMIDYYLAIASWLGCDSTDRNLELLTEPEKTESLKAKLPEIAVSNGPVVIMVPGGAFGPSKCWLSERFAQTADRLITNYNATVVISVAANGPEKQIAKQICDLSSHKLINLGDRPVSLGELKSLFSIADLVITNDTGPRHIAIALDRPVVSLFGPNNSQWTQTGHDKEVQIFGKAPCVPCDKPECKQNQHLCMESISVNEVFEAAADFLKI